MEFLLIFFELFSSSWLLLKIAKMRTEVTANQWGDNNALSHKYRQDFVTLNPFSLLTVNL